MVGGTWVVQERGWLLPGFRERGVNVGYSKRYLGGLFDFLFGLLVE